MHDRWNSGIGESWVSTDGWGCVRHLKLTVVRVRLRLDTISELHRPGVVSRAALVHNRLEVLVNTCVVPFTRREQRFNCVQSRWLGHLRVLGLVDKYLESLE